MSLALIATSYTNFWSHLTTEPTPHLLAALNATPKLNSPYAAIKLSPIGNGLPDLIALGMDEPARMTEARRASSMP